MSVEESKDMLQLKNVSWQVATTISSNDQAKTGNPVGFLQLNVADIDGKNAAPLTMELNHGEVLDLFNKIETIQQQLDSLAG